jgi:type II secretory pathway pseudopilin PulG
MVELLVVILLMMIIAGIGAPALQNLFTRTRLEGATREATVFLQRARMEAVKANTAAVVEFNFADPGGFRAFLDFDGDGTFNPVAGSGPRTTDYVVASSNLPGRVFFWGPSHGPDNGSDAVTDFTLVGADQKIVLRPDGSLADVGAFVLGDERGNFLRVELSTTARSQLSKWDGSSAWLSQDEAGEWEWK